MMTDLLLSILVPVYNVEDYLEECLRSLLDQGLDEGSYEIILTDDGSTDRSGAIAQAFAAEHSSVRYHRQANGGLSSARNAGLALARGKYLLHADADDLLRPRVLGDLLRDAEERALDLCLLDWADLCPDGRKQPQTDFSGVGAELLTGPDLVRHHRCYGTSWSFVMRRSVVEEGRLSFIPLQPGEDIAFFISAMPYCRRVGYHGGAIVYLYRRDRPGAITHGAQAVRDLRETVKLLRWIDDTFPYRGDRDDYASALAPWYDDILADTAMRRIALAGEEDRFAEILRPFRYRYPSERGARRVAFALMHFARRSRRLSAALWRLKRRLHP